MWPPKEICHICNEKNEWKESTNIGKIVEFSKKESVYFGLIEIDEGIKVLGNISCSSRPKIGQVVKMNVSFHDKPHYSFIVENN